MVNFSSPVLFPLKFVCVVAELYCTNLFRISFPNERRRLVALMAKYAATKQFVVLSGDVHYAEMMCAQLPGAPPGHVVVEVTSSGIS